MTAESSSLETYHKELAGAIDDLVTMVERTYDGFIRHNRTILKEAEDLGKKVHKFESTFAEKLLFEGKKGEDVRLLVALASHVERIGDCVESAIRTVHAKVNEGTLFSDKAVSELRDIFESTKALLRDVKDAVLTRNPVLVQHVLGGSEQLSKSAAEYSTAHEERLVAGVCQPRHSSLYLEIMDNLRQSGWHVKEMATKIGGPKAG